MGLKERGSASWEVYEFDASPTDESELAVLTHRMMGLKDPTRREVLHTLRGERKSHGDLEKELDRNPGAVHRALQNLVRDGLILQQVQARKRPVVRLYSLTPKGTYAVDLMDRYLAAADDTPLEVKTEVGTYVLYSRETKKAGKTQRVFFFAEKGKAPKNARAESAPPSRRLMVPHQEAPVLI